MRSSFNSKFAAFADCFKRKITILDVLFTALLILLLPVLIELLPEWYEWFGKEQNGLWMKRLYAFVDGRWMINVPIAILVITLAVAYGAKLFKDKSIRPFRVPLFCICFVLFYWDTQVIYAKVIPWLDYRNLCGILIFSLALVRLSVLIRFAFSQSQRCASNTSEFKGFSSDSINDNILSEELTSYASIIANRLINTNVEKNSYAVGITGEWGVGKTTFLNTIKKALESEMNVVEFNPWMCRTPEQVTNDFFASLRKQLSPKYSSLSKSIKEYARLIGALTISHRGFGLDLSNLTGVTSLSQKKSELSSRFAGLPKSVVVIIDDIDRLEREEVFEVLRLIRNTADLPNMIYLVAYDKEYITAVLEERKIKDASSYLEKIFPVEVHMPKVEDYLIWDRLKDDFGSQNDLDGAFTDNLFKQFKNQDKELILRVLDNYRRAKRFSRLYMLNARYIKKKCPTDINPIDFFWVELLQAYDKKAYDVLANDCYKLLYCDGDRMKIRGGIIHESKKDDATAYSGERFWREETPNLLDRAFGIHVRTNSKSICYRENYNKYFSLGVSKFRLSFKEFQSLFDGESNPDALVNAWLHDGKYFNSIVYHLKQVRVSALIHEQIQSFIHCVLSLGLRISSYHNSGVFELKDLLRDRRYVDEGQKIVAKNAVLSWMEERLAQTSDILLLARFLNILYVAKTYDEDGNPEPISMLLIPNEQIEAYLIKVMNSYLDNNLTVCASDVLKEDKGLAYLFKNCCVMISDNYAEGYGTYKQVAFDTIIENFSKKDKKPTKEEFDSLYQNLFSQETPVFTNPQDEYDYWEYLSEQMYRKKALYFGDDYTSKLDAFRERCFV